MFRLIQKTYPVLIRRNYNRYVTTINESARVRSNIIKFLYDHKQRPMPTAEKNVVLTNCPHCINTRKNSFNAYLNVVKGSYHCKTCHTKGSFPEFSQTLLKKVTASLPPKEINSASTLMNKPELTLSKSAQELKSYPAMLKENTTVMNYLIDKHKIKKEIWDMYQVGMADAQHLTFPQTALMLDENDMGSFKTDITRLKTCAIEEPLKTINMDPPTANLETASGLFGYHTTVNHDTLILTRRELEAMAAYQETGIPAVSIPTDNYQLQESVLPLLDRFSRIYVWMDDDVDGQLAAERFVHKIGDSKCMLVNTRLGESEGPVTAYDALQSAKDLKSIIASSKRIKHDQIVDFSDLKEEVYNEILHPDQTRGIQSTDLPKLNEILKGHRPGELTILTGPTGSGKTTVISQLSLDYCKSGLPTLWGSFEIQNKRLMKKMLYQFAGKDISLNPKEFHAIADKFEQLPLYFLKFFSSTAIEDVLKACQHAVYAYDVRHIILDNLQFMLSQQGRSSLDKWELQDSAIAEIRRFATERDVHITLVVHPRKDVGDQLDINSIFGSAKVTQEADNVVILQSGNDFNNNTRSLDIKKNRYDGTLGSIPFKFIRESSKIEQLPVEQTNKFKYGTSRNRGSTSTTIFKRAY
ncbi:P-loop containing nucleoside triphosphate hydrolase protein [Backusella circina FSU 941]|nr:P-loop containing nucleoside triphosphate hydrolase protein [Backusella circina FSU 941]